MGTTVRWLWVAAAAGIGIFVLAFAPGWIVHDRELRGEGYRHVQIVLSAWRGPAVPVTAAAAVGALAVGSASALVALRGRSVAGWVLVGGAIVVLALIAASAWPVIQSGHASSVRLSPGLVLPVALLLAAGMVAATIAFARPPRPMLGAAALLGCVVLAGAAGGRWLGLQVAEGTGQHWRAGSYTRAATGGEATEVLTLDGATYAIGDRWRGTFESSGWTVTLDDDPACPESRGTYHAHGVDEEDLRFVMVVDTCSEGARAADLTTGTWERNP